MPCKRIHFKAQVNNLVANLAGVARVTDPRLVNAWGIVEYNNTIFAVSNDLSQVLNYDLEGAILPTTITVPGGEPTAIVVNRTAFFPITAGPVTLPATFLIATENGTIYGYNADVDPVNAILVIDRSGVDAVYTGIAIANNKIFAADFFNKRIDVFDANYNLLTGYLFPDIFYNLPIPATFAPFNIADINGKLYVTYAQQDPVTPENQFVGAGLGFINIFDYNGLFIRRFTSQGALNAPWGLAFAPENFGDAACHLLVGNFGDGRVSVFNHCGKFVGFLRNKCGDIIVIDGLWGLLRYKKKIYFAAGPNGQTNGLVGTIGEREKECRKKDNVEEEIMSYYDNKCCNNNYNYYDNYNY